MKWEVKKRQRCFVDLPPVGGKINSPPSSLLTPKKSTIDPRFKINPHAQEGVARDISRVGRGSGDVGGSSSRGGCRGAQRAARRHHRRLALPRRGLGRVQSCCCCCCWRCDRRGCSSVSIPERRERDRRLLECLGGVEECVSA